MQSVFHLFTFLLPPLHSPFPISQYSYDHLCSLLLHTDNSAQVGPCHPDNDKTSFSSDIIWIQYKSIECLHVYFPMIQLCIVWRGLLWSGCVYFAYSQTAEIVMKRIFTSKIYCALALTIAFCFSKYHLYVLQQPMQSNISTC